ncbi:peptidyl-prolyl cis-trans isomerase [Shimia abyssi]|uniref:peptidylprolyl isomerase n=1 Tax=Shimia abyssi TaxID=1662395 RepID=A0A2P8F8K1_9RHOB|nr:peptidylprolyl isomerase [Shimia abyssi]PSL18038.1 parvulin-like peptidyl-prolyl cis-trans isomerase protein [Shimia abyssi]
MMRILKEPLLHFLLIGVAIFAFYAVISPPLPTQQATKKINVTPAQVQQLQARFQNTWSRKPNADELNKFIDAFIREEVLSREALALSMDQGDAVIRQRLVQKMEFLMTSAAAATPATEDELRTFYSENSETYATPPRITFEHVFLGDAVDETAISKILEQLNTGADPSTLGQRLMLPPSLRDVPKRTVDSGFGAGFFDQIALLPSDTWVAPVSSGFGQHAVYVLNLTPSAPPPLEVIRDRVEADWTAQVADKLSEEVYATLRDTYEITRPDNAALSEQLK